MKQTTFETDRSISSLLNLNLTRRRYLLNLPLDLKPENARQSATEHRIKEVIVSEAGKPTFLKFFS